MLWAFPVLKICRPRSSRSEPSRIKEGTQGCLLLACTTGFPKTALPESVPQSGTPKLFTLLYSLFTCPAPAFPSHSLGAPESCSAGGRRISSTAAMRDCKTPFPPHSPACRAQAHSEPVPQSGTPKLFTLLYSLVPPRPSPPTSRERQRAALSRGAEDQFPGGNAGLQNALSPRTAPHAGHRLILNPCRRAALRNSSLFPIHSPSPAPFSLRDGQQNKNIFCFLAT